jgi:hypothetical protein
VKTLKALWRQFLLGFVAILVMPSLASAQCTVSAGVDITKCFGQIVNLGVSVSTTGASPFQFSWNGGTSWSASPTFIITANTSDTYTVTVKDANNCQSTDQINLTVLPLPIVDAGPDVAMCPGAIVTLCGTASSSNGAITSVTWIPSFANTACTNFSPSSTTNYIFSVIDASNCQASNSVQVLVYPNLTVNAGADQAMCLSAGTMQLTGTSSSGAPNSGSWSGPGVNTSGLFTATAVGSYTLTYSKVSFLGCTFSDNMVLTILDQSPLNGCPPIEPSFEVTNLSCFDDSSGAIVVTANGGTEVLMYSLDGLVYTSNNEFLNLPAGITSVYVMDENQNVQVSEVEITEPDILEATAEATSVSCAGYTNGSLLITATGGTEIYAFSINGVDYSPSPLFNDLGIGMYSIYVEDANGCVFEMANAAEVTEPTALTATGEAMAETCFDANDGQIIIDAQGGTAPYTYSIDNVEYNNSPIGDLEAGTYDVHIIDNNSCEVEVMSLGVTQPDALAINNLTPNAIDEDAGGNNAYTVTGGTAPYVFEWTYNGNVVSTNQDLDDLTDPAQQGDYTLEVTDGNGCTATQQIPITDIDELTASNSVSMFPNPNNGLFQINITAKSSTKMSYTLADETGRIALAKELGNVAGTRTENIDATQCAKGIYYLSIRMGDVTHISKLIIQ